MSVHAAVPDRPVLPRRAFLKSAALAAAATAAAPAAHRVFAAGSDTIRVGLIGCGERGTAAALDCIKAAPGVEIVALGDLFKDALDASLSKLKEAAPQAVTRLTPETCFTGFDNHLKVLACDVNLVLLATPPIFRPSTSRPPSRRVKTRSWRSRWRWMARRALPAAQTEMANRRNSASPRAPAAPSARYNEAIKRIHDGAIGDISMAAAIGMAARSWVLDRKRAGATWSGSAGTGTISRGLGATTSSSSTSIIWMS